MKKSMLVAGIVAMAILGAVAGVVAEQSKPVSAQDVYVSMTRELAQCNKTLGEKARELGETQELQAKVAEGTLANPENVRKQFLAQILKEFAESNPELTIDSNSKWKVSKRTEVKK